MPSSNLIRTGGGLASAAAGLLLLLGHLLDLGGDPEYGTVLGGTLVLAAHVVLVFALVALYAAQAEQSGLLGNLGMVLGVVGTTLVSGVVLVEIAGASGAGVDTVLSAGLPGVLALLGGLAFLIGLILFGAATMRAGVFPRWAGLLLIVGDVVFGMGSFAGSAATIFEILGAALTCAALVWLGLSLLLGSGASARQPTRVSQKVARMMELIKAANLHLRFLMELCALGALGYWGFKTGNATITKTVLGVGAPLVAAVVWGIFVSPQAPVLLPWLVVLLLQVLVFGSAAAGLLATGHRTLALAFAVTVVINTVLMYVWGQ